ncbi:START domain protein [Necator americanus]|uniref:START domain-containing protein 10 n=1 Tax=Necator americanus TaxID=51031 RepID=W2TDM8_NECAM|nr:START domain protein [Necator americanus]ETN79127.1 START domain protein [Necator americanus]
MRVNVARVWEDADYVKVRNMCDSTQGWHEVYKKKMITVYTQSVPCSHYQMIKAEAKFPDVLPSVAYDVLHDSSYRAHWDRHMAAQCYIGMINPNNDIGYYALTAMPPIRARDFVMQRSWLDTGDEKMICGHSVCHQDYPPMKGFIRATALLSAYLIRPFDENGCQITYISHSDPKGKLPTWLVNRLTRVIAPKVIKRLHKACLAYPDWKEDNQPHLKPWIFAEQQMEFPRVDLSKCQPQEYEQEIIDESSERPSKEIDVEEE